MMTVYAPNYATRSLEILKYKTMSALDRAELRARQSLHWQREKVRAVNAALEQDPVDIESLRRHAVSMGGLVHSRLRRRVWPKLVGVNVYAIAPYSGPPLASHKDRAQVLLDVRRCGKRVPPSFSAEQRQELQDQLTRIILRLLAENKDLHYYQGLHDIVITFLLVAGEDITYAIMTVLVLHHIRDFLDVDMNRTKVIINYLRPLLMLEDPQLESFITESECAYYFSLSWLITWYGHVVCRMEDANRLADVFLATHPLMALYIAAAIILTRSSEVLALECEMSAVHGLLSRLPEQLSYEQMVVLASQLYAKHPPKILARKAGLRLSTSSMISGHPKFLRSTSAQCPDRVLASQPPLSKETRWWHWRPYSEASWLSSRLLLRLATLVGPVILAVAVYWVNRYLAGRTAAHDITYPT